MIRIAKPFIFVLCLVPFFLLVWGLLTNDVAYLGANPVETITHNTGDWILRFLVLTLCITPLRQLTGWTWLTRFRRMLGLFAFFYIPTLVDGGFSAVFSKASEAGKMHWLNAVPSPGVGWRCSWIATSSIMYLSLTVFIHLT